MKKLLIWLFAVIVLFVMNVVPALAAVDVSVSTPVVSTQTEISPKAHETVWVVRYDENGNRQRRLWSITYGKWLTDWMDWPEEG